MCKGENGEYLYIVNKIGTIDQNNEDNREDESIFIGKKNKLSTGALIAIILSCSLALISAIIAVIVIIIKKKKNKIESHKTEIGNHKAKMENYKINRSEDFIINKNIT